MRSMADVPLRCTHGRSRIASMGQRIIGSSFSVRRRCHVGCTLLPSNGTRRHLSNQSLNKRRCISEIVRCFSSGNNSEHVDCSGESHDPERASSILSSGDYVGKQYHEVSAMENTVIYSWLNLQSFSDDEIREVARTLRRCSEDNGKESRGSISVKGVKKFMMERIKRRIKRNGNNIDQPDSIGIEVHEYLNNQARKFMTSFRPEDDTIEIDALRISESDMKEKLIEMASTVDYRKVFPLAFSTLLVGSSVGVTIPLMPFISSSLNLSKADYGYVVSAFAASKVVGNFPAAVLVDRFGRKPFFVYSLSLVAFGVGGIGLASYMEELILCRLLSGFAVAGLSTASTMMISDISTPLNRASTMAPVMSCFAAGMALGPAIGGLLADQIGVEPTFFVVSASFFSLTAVNQLLLRETKPKDYIFPWEKSTQNREVVKKSLSSSVTEAIAQWSPLMSNDRVKNVLVFNGIYWLALSGVQMTCLPLFLTDPSGPFCMGATAVGQVYMGMSIVQVICNPGIAMLADKIGKTKAMVGGGSLLSMSIAAMTQSTDLIQLAAAMGFWTIGSTMLSTAPVAYISDIVEAKKRAQSIALLRTSGDLGFFVGAASIGMVGDFTGDLSLAMQTGGGILFAGTSWYAARQYLSEKLLKI